MGILQIPSIARLLSTPYKCFWKDTLGLVWVVRGDREAEKWPSILPELRQTGLLVTFNRIHQFNHNLKLIQTENLNEKLSFRFSTKKNIYLLSLIYQKIHLCVVYGIFLLFVDFFTSNINSGFGWVIWYHQQKSFPICRNRSWVSTVFSLECNYWEKADTAWMLRMIGLSSDFSFNFNFISFYFLYVLLWTAKMSMQSREVVALNFHSKYSWK